MSEVPEKPETVNEVANDADQPLSKSALKKQKKMEELARKKAEKAALQSKKDAEEEANAAEARAKFLEESKSIVLKQDSTLPEAQPITVADVKKYIGQRVKLTGFCSTIRRQGYLLFIELRDGTGFPNTIQCVLEGDNAKCYNGLTIAREATVTLYGTLVEASKSKSGVELSVDYWEVINPSHSDIENIYNKNTSPDILLDQRHIVLRENRSIYIMRLRCLLMQSLREHFWSKGFYEVTPPTIVQNQVEGGSTLFKFDYYGSAAYLTQSSQLYLETCVPVLGKVFCAMPSYRAEKSHTRRHLSEFTHFEGEVGFITFEDLLNILEDMVVSVAELLEQKAGDMLRHINPNFQVPKRGFKRMDYSDAIEWLRENKVYKDKETEEFYEFGDDIPEAPERFMTDTIGEPIFLCRFPAAMKSFYMARDAKDNRLTESVDLLMPGVGEIVGASMRSWDLQVILDGYKNEGIDPTNYYWYNDLRKYGSHPHGGWGLGVERYICWILGLESVRETCLYPRFPGRAAP